MKVMKKIMFLLAALFITAATAQAMTYSTARTEARFLTDKMAYELGLYDSQYDAVYEINLDYMLALSSSSDIYGNYWRRRDTDLSYVLTAAQYSAYKAADYFYMPVYWDSGFQYRIYKRYTNRTRYYYATPSVYYTYKGTSAKQGSGRSRYMGKSYDGGKKMTVVRSGHSAKAVPDKGTKAKKTTTTRRQSSTAAKKQSSTTKKQPANNTRNHSSAVKKQPSATKQQPSRGTAAFSGERR